MEARVVTSGRAFSPTLPAVRRAPLVGKSDRAGSRQARNVGGPLGGRAAQRTRLNSPNERKVKLASLTGRERASL
jgi:hypothetical protein